MENQLNQCAWADRQVVDWAAELHHSWTQSFLIKVGVKLYSKIEWMHVFRANFYFQVCSSRSYKSRNIQCLMIWLRHFISPTCHRNHRRCQEMVLVPVCHSEPSKKLFTTRYKAVKTNMYNFSNSTPPGWKIHLEYFSLHRSEFSYFETGT